VLTFDGGNTASVEDQPNETNQIADYAVFKLRDSLRSDMNRVLAGRNFDSDRDAAALYVYRWGQARWEREFAPAAKCCRCYS
jgi:hypothetical protein